jgi:hypothetical protein
MKGCDLIAVGNAHGSDAENAFDPERVEWLFDRHNLNSTLTALDRIADVSGGVTTGY